VGLKAVDDLRKPHAVDTAIAGSTITPPLDDEAARTSQEQ
jgi:hypothetical protein